ncbi:MAG: histidinol dehydrogenase [Coriobacteriia bacterium]|nr:histidinol dehydrogenase [Coriobacteriia bacterium]
MLEPGMRLAESDLLRSGGVDAEALNVASRIVDDVRRRGDKALRAYTLQFDKAKLGDLRVSEAEIDQAMETCDEAFIDAITMAAAAITDFHERELPQSWFTTQEGGVFLGQKVTPLSRVGIYVPGGRARYPSSVLMNAIPAVVAGVEEIAMVVPPAEGGSVDPHTLAAAALVGVHEIYRVGGAQAIAGLAYGTDSIPKVDKIVGPGNAYVTAAKKIVMGDVGIDMLAGPSEVLVLADESAIPVLTAIDLMAQAEHDPHATSYLVTVDPDFPDLVEESIRLLLEESPRREVTARALTDNGLVVVCPDVFTALDAVNLIAPEHLEMQVMEPLELLSYIRNAGAIFLGNWTPESVGDYVAGPNHVLPTAGTARFSSPLSVNDFVKRSSVLNYSVGALRADASPVVEIAGREGLWAHAQAVILRLEVLDSILSDDDDFDDDGGFDDDDGLDLGGEIVDIADISGFPGAKGQD